MTGSSIIWRDLLTKKMLICIFTGFTSGLPLFILISLLPAWLMDSGLELKAIALFSFIQLPYVLKFLWAPLFDGFSFSMGRRRGWLIIFQVLLLASISMAGLLDPKSQIMTVAIISTSIAFFSASQDAVIDAYRRELLLDNELGLGTAIHVNAYRIAGLIPGSLALILADVFAWELVFFITGLFMIPGIILTILIKEPLLKVMPPKTLKEAVIEPFVEFINRKGIKEAILILLFIFLYKIGDSMATALATPFFMDLGFSMTEIGVIAKTVGFWASIIGGILGGISSGQDIVTSFSVKPTSSILTSRKTIDKKGKNSNISVKGRHDPCVGIRAVPIGEAMLACVLLDHYLMNRAQCG